MKRLFHLLIAAPLVLEAGHHHHGHSSHSSSSSEHHHHHHSSHSSSSFFDQSSDECDECENQVDWIRVTLPDERLYLNWDNETYATTEDIHDDPLIALRKKVNRDAAFVDFSEGFQHLLLSDTPFASQTFDNTIDSGNNTPFLGVQNPISHFEYAPFNITLNGDECELVHWQIGYDSDFTQVPTNFEQTQPFNTPITLPLVSETYFYPHKTYYFRVRGLKDGSWGPWSKTYSFLIRKPLQVSLVEFETIGEHLYELDWSREAEESKTPIEYFVFGSNAEDFIPSIYSDVQINALDSAGNVSEAEINDNLVTVTTDTKIVVDGTLAYYRIIAKKGGQYSVPSPLIRVYDHDLVYPRNALQLCEDENGAQVIKRTLFPKTYSWSKVALPEVREFKPLSETGLFKVHSTLAHSANVDYGQFPYNPHVSPEIWGIASAYFLPSNHPARPKLDFIFGKKRITLTPSTMRNAGFNRYTPGRHNRVIASSHPNLQEYFIKCYADSELSVLNDWARLKKRIEGSNVVRECIIKHGYQNIFSVPQKYLYPLPENPSPPSDGKRYLRKNFILVAQNMQILDHSRNDKAYKKKMTKARFDALFIMLQECGLWDSVFNFNIPFCRDGRMAFIDTEYWHKWPVNFLKMSKYFSKDGRKYWEKLILNGGPKQP